MNLSTHLTESNEGKYKFEEILASTKSKKYLTDGYLIEKNLNNSAFIDIQKFIAETASKFTGLKISTPEDFLNTAHEKISSESLNKLRLFVINTIASEGWVRPAYYELCKALLHELVGNELVMQKRLNLSIQMPRDDSSLLPMHADVWSGDSPYEVVVWVPLVNCFSTKAMYILPPNYELELREELLKKTSGNSEDLFKKFEDKVKWLSVKAGEVLIFNQNLPHGNRVNGTNETRWSMNCRFKSALSPYGDKKIGEFFEPISLRAASRIGMDYKLPKIRLFEG
jgi:sporadic carbohydrate cluster 2OG-Fe(II) oxygenase